MGGMNQENKWIVTFIAIIGVCLALIGGYLVMKKYQGEKPVESTERPSSDPTASQDDLQTEIVESPGGDADKRFADALAILAEGRSDEYESALAEIISLAEEGNTDAQYFAGEMYLQGMGVEADLEKAAGYLGQAYQNGNEKAFSIYGKLAFMGEGIGQDYESAYGAFASLSQPSEEIYCGMGIMNAYGMGVRIDYDAALYYLEKAVDMGSATAQTVKDAIGDKTYERRESEAWIDLRLERISKTDYSFSEIENLDELVARAYEQVAGSENYTAFAQEMEAMSQVSLDVAATKSIYGRDNWLFFQNEADGDSYHDYVGDNEFTDDELAAIKENLEKQKKRVEDAGSRFVLVIYPNKEIIYSEKMPSYIVRESQVTRTDKLVQYLEENSEVEIIYLKEKCMEMKPDYQLYYASDTHCNMLGAFLGISELMNQEYEKDMELDVSQFDIHFTTYAGDISVLLGREERYSMDTVYFLAEDRVPEQDKSEDSMILIGDSFSEFFNMEAAYYFKGGVSHYLIGDYGYDFEAAMDAAFSAGKGDLVVWVCVERCIDRLK